MITSNSSSPIRRSNTSSRPVAVSNCQPASVWRWGSGRANRSLLATASPIHRLADSQRRCVTRLESRHHRVERILRLAKTCASSAIAGTASTVDKAEIRKSLRILARNTFPRAVPFLAFCEGALAFIAWPPPDGFFQDLLGLRHFLNWRFHLGLGGGRRRLPGRFDRACGKTASRPHRGACRQTFGQCDIPIRTGERDIGRVALPLQPIAQFIFPIQTVHRQLGCAAFIPRFSIRSRASSRRVSSGCQPISSRSTSLPIFTLPSISMSGSRMIGPPPQPPQFRNPSNRSNHHHRLKISSISAKVENAISPVTTAPPTSEPLLSSTYTT